MAEKNGFAICSPWEMTNEKWKEWIAEYLIRNES